MTFNFFFLHFLVQEPFITLYTVLFFKSLKNICRNSSDKVRCGEIFHTVDANAKSASNPASKPTSTSNSASNHVHL